MTSLADGAVGNSLREARSSRSCNDFAQILVLDSGGQPGTLFPEALGRFQWGRFEAFRPSLVRIGEASGSEANTVDAEPLRDLCRPIRQLERPDRVRRVDV